MGGTEGNAEIVIVPICAHRHLIFIPVGESTFSMSDTDVHSVCWSSEVKYLGEKDRRRWSDPHLFILGEDI